MTEQNIQRPKGEEELGHLKELSTSDSGTRWYPETVEG